MAEHTALYGRCRAFVEEQSCGEWDDKTIREDALKLQAFITFDPAVADLVKALEKARAAIWSGGDTVASINAIDVALSRFRELEKGNG